MLNITTEVVESGKRRGSRPLKTRSLKRYLLEKGEAWINALLEAERDEFLGRGRYELLDEEHDNYRNGKASNPVPAMPANKEYDSRTLHALTGYFQAFSPGETR